MSDLISRCELFNRLAPVQTLGEAYGIIQGMDTVDAVPVRKGQWITNKYNQTVCSECTSPALEVETGCLVNRHLEPYKTHFCPNCGAYMRWE